MALTTRWNSPREASVPPFSWTYALCGWLATLNVADALFTLTYLQTNLAEEANPFMRAAYEISPLAFVALKLVLVQVGIWVLLPHATKPSVRIALAVLTAAYAGVVGYHLGFLATLAHL